MKLLFYLMIAGGWFEPQHRFSNSERQRDAILVPQCPHCGRKDFPHWSAAKRHVKYCTGQKLK